MQVTYLKSTRYLGYIDVLIIQNIICDHAVDSLFVLGGKSLSMLSQKQEKKTKTKLLAAVGFEPTPSK